MKQILESSECRQNSERSRRHISAHPLDNTRYCKDQIMARPGIPIGSETPHYWFEYEQILYSDRKAYSRVNWEGMLNFQFFVSSCPYQECHVELIHKARCPIRCVFCKSGDSRVRRDAIYRRAEEAREKAAQEARDLTARAEEENPGLFMQDKLWLPHAPGVALIRGDLLADVANFFWNCDITVQEHNEPTTNYWLQDTGYAIFKLLEHPDMRIFVRPTRQVRVQIDRFRLPPDTVDLENPEWRVLCNMQGAHGNAMHRLLLFLGFTGKNSGGDREIDKECSYWYYSASGFDPDFSKIGDTPFRIVRVPTEPAPDLYEIMLRLGLKRGKEEAKHFRDNFNETVKEWKFNPESQEDLISGNFDNVLAESSDEDEPNAPEVTDSSDDSDITNLSDMSGPTDRSGVPMNRKERAEIEKRFAEARAARERELAAQAARAAQAAEEERLAAQVADEEEADEIQDARSRRRERRQTARARELAEEQVALERKRAKAQADRQRRLAEAAEEEEVYQTESHGTMAPEEGQDVEEREDGIESVGNVESGEDVDPEGESESDRPRRFPRLLPKGAKV